MKFRYSLNCMLSEWQWQNPTWMGGGSESINEKKSRKKRAKVKTHSVSLYFVAHINVWTGLNNQLLSAKSQGLRLHRSIQSSNIKKMKSSLYFHSLKLAQYINNGTIYSMETFDIIQHYTSCTIVSALGLQKLKSFALDVIEKKKRLSNFA